MSLLDCVHSDLESGVFIADDFGQEVKYIRGSDICKKIFVIEQRDIEIQFTELNTAMNKHVKSYLVMTQDIKKPMDGDKIVLDDITYVVDGTLDSNEHYSILSVK